MGSGLLFLMVLALLSLLSAVRARPDTPTGGALAWPEAPRTCASAPVSQFVEGSGLARTGSVPAQTLGAAARIAPQPARRGGGAAPPEGAMVLDIDLDRRTLTVLIDGKPFKTYQVSIGTRRTPTPVGEWRVVHKDAGWGGGFGTRWMGWNVPWGIYGIHGTNKPWSVGLAASEGCIRMRNAEVEELYGWVPIGTRVIVRASSAVRPRVARTLRTGASGQDVVWLQERLRGSGALEGAADARYGPATRRAVESLERAYGLLPDGVADPEVLEVLELR